MRINNLLVLLACSTSITTVACVDGDADPAADRAAYEAQVVCEFPISEVGPEAPREQQELLDVDTNPGPPREKPPEFAEMVRLEPGDLTCEKFIETEGPCSVACDREALATYVPEGWCFDFLCHTVDGGTARVGACHARQPVSWKPLLHATAGSAIPVKGK